MNKKTFKKRAFISAIAMLVVSAIVLTSATFAWFAMSSQVKVDEMKLSITAPQGVQISANPFAFTSTLLYENLKEDYNKATNRFGAYVGNMNNFPLIMEPVSTTFCYRLTNPSSRALPAFFRGDMNNDGVNISISALSSSNPDTYYGEKGAPYAVFDVFIKIGDSSRRIYFDKSTITCEGNEDVPSTMRMGFVNCGVVADVKEADFTADKVLNVRPVKSDAAAEHKVIAFDADHHTAEAISNHKVTEGTTYKTDAMFKAVNTFVEYQNKVPSSTGNTENVLYEVQKYKDGSLKAREVGGSETTAAPYFVALQGINRVRVYIWMEGNDVDCATDVAGQDLDVQVVFTIDLNEVIS